jgi:cytidyltransferase-like protein
MLFSLQGHIAVLKEARKLGTFLLVGIQSDETVNAMRGLNFTFASITRVIYPS